MFRIQLLVFSLIFTVAFPNVYGGGKSVKFHNCKSIFTIKEVTVDPCPGGNDPNRCPLKKGTSSTISVTFIPNKSVGNFTATVHGIISTIPTEFQLPNKDACKANLTCPLVAGKEYTYAESVPVLSMYPNLSLLIRWVLDSPGEKPMDENGTPRKDVCFIIKANIVD